MRTRLVVAAIAVAIVSTSCSTSNATKPSTATSTTAPDAPTTTEPATTSTYGPKVIVTPPPTTTTPQQALEAEIRAAALRNKAAYRACVHEPVTCDPATFAAEPYLSYARSYIAENLVAIGRHVEFDPTDPIYTVVGSVLVAANGESAEYDECTWDTGITVQVLADADPIVIDDLKGTFHHHESVQLVDGQWLLTHVVETSTAIIGRNDCGPRP
jgi:hypothetical protein